MPQAPKTAVDRETLSWSAERRVEFIDYRLFWEGRINRGDLTRTFGISNPQATADLTKYLEMAPGNMDYDRSAKYYFATPHFKPVLITPDAEQYLLRLRSEASTVMRQDMAIEDLEPVVQAVRMPMRSIEPRVLRQLLIAIRAGKALEVEYQSLNRPDVTMRWTTPHALAFDGFRWHVRAFCHEHNSFRDFLLGRILSVGAQKPHKMDSSLDTVWHQYATLKIGPHPGLTEAQKRIIERDYGMTNGVAAIEVRAALVFYLIWGLRLEAGDMERPAKSQQIVLLNREEIEDAVGTSGHQAAGY
jgi:hypothetical protein